MNIDRAEGGTHTFRSTPRKLIIWPFLISAVLFSSWVWIMSVADPNLWVFRFLGVFLFLATLVSAIQSIRQPYTVVLDAESFTCRRGKNETVIPWHVLEQEQSRLKLENVFGWQRLSIRAKLNDRRTRLHLDNIFGVGLPVQDILREVQERISQAALVKELDPFARSAARAFLARFPELTYAVKPRDGVLEVSLKSPETGYELVLTTENDELTIYFDPFPWHQHFDFPPERAEENCFGTFNALLNERLLILQTTEGSWMSTDVVRPAEMPMPLPDQVLRIRSFRGTYNRDIYES